MKTRTLTCAYCGKEFESSANNIKYCSPECRSKATYENRKDYIKEYYKKYGRKSQIRKRVKIADEKVCPVCGKVFTTTDKRQKYCSSECRGENERIAASEYREKKRVYYTKTCPACGKEFTTSRSLDTYCCVDCYNKAVILRNKENSKKPEYKRRHNERSIAYQVKIKKLGMTSTEFKEFVASGADVEQYLLDRGMDNCIKYCKNCGKKFYSLSDHKVYCDDCSQKTIHRKG